MASMMMIGSINIDLGNWKVDTGMSKVSSVAARPNLNSVNFSKTLLNDRDRVKSTTIKTIEKPKISDLFADCVPVVVPKSVKDDWLLSDSLFAQMRKYIKFTVEGRRILYKGWESFAHNMERFAYTYTRKMKEAAIGRLNKTFDAPDEVINSIHVKEEDVKAADTTVKPCEQVQRKVRAKPRKNYVTWSVDKLIDSVRTVSESTGIEIQVIGKRANRPLCLRGVRRYGTKCFKVTTRHECGIYKPVDCYFDEVQRPVFERLMRPYERRRTIQSKMLTYGDSGLVLSKKEALGGICREDEVFFIVRGRLLGNLVDAREPLNFESQIAVDHYNDVAKEFWDGYSTTFVEHKNQIDDHVCERDVSVYECGKVAAFLTLIYGQCGKITCGKCAKRVAEMSLGEYSDAVLKEMERLSPFMSKSLASFEHVQQFVDVTKNIASHSKMNYDAFTENIRLIGDRSDAPYSHLLNLNNGIVKLLHSSDGDATRLAEELRQLVRWHKNRIEHVKTGSLATFRNKILAKNQLNLSLLCDNQRDQNGNFVWGLRGAAVNRFFKNYFTEVVVGGKYEQYQVRHNPRGSRQLAIGHLVMPTDLAALRGQLKGERIDQGPVGENCISRLHGNFLNPCCCVTHDNGVAYESAYMAPTKHHLVVGSPIDPKYIDLPQGKKPGMYIPKEGYCYILIFIAMLLNVEEEKAKQFTKIVRDVLVPKLGTWPKMIDVATACHFLSILHPDTRTAEIPRILVDHQKQILHVIDSYGSATSGYHYLKAGTVAQLILFANDDLQSEIKEYLVGGEKDVTISVHSRRSGCKPQKSLTVLEKMPESHFVKEITSEVGEASTSQQQRNKGCGSNEEQSYPCLNQPLASATNTIWEHMKFLIRAIHRPQKMRQILEDEPFLLLLGILSPAIIKALFESGTFSDGLRIWINRDSSVAHMLAILDDLAVKTTRSDMFWEQLRILEEGYKPLCEKLSERRYPSASYGMAFTAISLAHDRIVADKELNQAGFYASGAKIASYLEKNYTDELAISWSELSLCGKLRVMKHTCMRRLRSPDYLQGDKQRTKEWKEASGSCLKRCSKTINASVAVATYHTKRFCKNVLWKSNQALVHIPLKILQGGLPQLFKHVSMLAVLSLLIAIIHNVTSMVNEHKRMKREAQKIAYDKREKQLGRIFELFIAKHGTELSEAQWEDFERSIPDELKTHYREEWCGEKSVTYQSKSKQEHIFEQIIGFLLLATLMFSPARSDVVFKVLNKVKSVLTSTAPDCRFQSLDTIDDILESKQQVVDVELSTNAAFVETPFDSTFEKWWDNQMQVGNTIPHYRTGGFFMEFKRNWAPKFCSDVINSDEKEFLISGAVGSGKSTGLPFNLSQKGRILVLEPTRPLAENVCAQLRKHPFFCSPSLFMRNVHTVGHSPIDVMTSGFALHSLANKREKIFDYQFIMFDECHVLDSSAMAFYCLLQEVKFPGKILKVSATPPGHECEFETQHPVEVIREASLTFTQFAQNLGTGAHSDVLKKGVNILVYVASYNDVDSLSKLLIEKQFMVTKIDGRTLKSGTNEIATRGTKEKPHFLVATNIIENGVTLDIDVVVDFGTKVVAQLDSDSRRITYSKTNISYGERIQRLGRVGRNKPGTALRLGHTEMGLSEIPVSIATEAAFLSFAYNLPVMTHNVSTCLLGKCTKRQAITALQFELPIYYTSSLIASNGSMHPEIHEVLKPYKLRYSRVEMHELSFQMGHTAQWLTVRDYSKLGVDVQCEPEMKLAFYARDVPERLHEKIWRIVCDLKTNSTRCSIRSHNASKIAYTLRTDPTAVQTSIAIIDQLLEEEQLKQSYMQSLSLMSSSASFISWSSMINAVRSRYAVDHTGENIEKLQRVKARLTEFNNITRTGNYHEAVTEFMEAEAVHYQNKNDMSKFVGLKGKWDSSLLTRDLIVCSVVLVGGIWLTYEHLLRGHREDVTYQGKGNAARAKQLKMRANRDKRTYRIDAPEEALGQFFGEAYTKHGKKSGKSKTHGMGKKAHRFYHVYGFDPSDYLLVRYVDPLTGATYDEHPLASVASVQEKFSEIRSQKIANEELELQRIYSTPGIQAYFMKGAGKTALKIDLTPHQALRVSDISTSIMGFPEREGELRQTGKPSEVPIESVPEGITEEVSYESKAMCRGLRDYNPISSCVCKLTNSSDGHDSELFGIGYGPFIITNRHLFRHNNGTLRVNSRHGEFKVMNTTQLLMSPVGNTDILLIRMPKDYPPMPSKLIFRAPQADDKVCMVSTNFQTKFMSSAVSETSVIRKVSSGEFWQHWITTLDGQCGSPFVSTRDGAIVGIHSLASMAHAHNYFAPFPANFLVKYLENSEALEWTKHWKFNADKICWGTLNVHEDVPDGLFKISKLISDLKDDLVYAQDKRQGWICSKAEGNLLPVAACEGSLVTKHVIKGPCMLFSTYLATNPDKEAFFRPLMGHYGKSRLNKAAFVQDFFKYADSIELGNIEMEILSQAKQSVIRLLLSAGVGSCNYVTDTDSIFESLNMKAAVGALYKGKKKEYFEQFSNEDRDKIIQDSCFRLFSGKMGVWNGSLKAELRPIEKISLNKTRTFTAAPLDSLLGGKVCVDDFNNQFYEGHMKGPWTVGMTKFYKQWDVLFRMLPDGWVYCDADGSRFDSSLTPVLLNCVLDIRSEFLEDWDIGEQMLRNFYTEIVYTPIAVPDGSIIKKCKGNNSGQPSTVVDNTLMVMLAMQYSLAKLGVEYEGQEDVIKYFANGDDLLIAVRPDFCDHILDHLGSLFNQLGLIYDFSHRTREKSELFYLSHCGVLKDGIYIPKLEKERIVSILEWDKSSEPIQRLEAICAAIIEAWGYDDLIHEIRTFYSWVLEQAPYNELAREGKAPYLAELALRHLYTDEKIDASELLDYVRRFQDLFDDELPQDNCIFQAQVDAGDERAIEKAKKAEKDVDAGSSGVTTIIQAKSFSKSMKMPQINGKKMLDLSHLLQYKPAAEDLYNTRASQAQLEHWYNGIMKAYEINTDEMAKVLNGLIVWCIENGTSPNLRDTWRMEFLGTFVEYPLQPIIEFAQPSLRQIMRHFSNIAESYIVMRNQTERYMPRYAIQRGLTDYSLARFAFDFYDVTAQTSVRAREAVAQMKAAALRGASSKLFTLDGKVGTATEDTERHTVEDVNRNMHSMLGVRGVI